MIKEAILVVGLLAGPSFRDASDERKDFVYRRLAVENIREESYLSALDYIKRGIEHGKEENYYNLLGMCYLGLNENEKALNEFSKYVVRFPNDADGFDNVGCAYVKSKEFEKAKKAFELAISMEPKNGQFYFNAASNYLGLFSKSKKREDLILSASFFIYSEYLGKEDGLEKAIDVYELGINKKFRYWDDKEFERWDEFRSKAVEYLEEIFTK